MSFRADHWRSPVRPRGHLRVKARRRRSAVPQASVEDVQIGERHQDAELPFRYGEQSRRIPPRLPHTLGGVVDVSLVDDRPELPVRGDLCSSRRPSPIQSLNIHGAARHARQWPYASVGESRVDRAARTTRRMVSAGQASRSVHPARSPRRRQLDDGWVVVRLSRGSATRAARSASGTPRSRSRGSSVTEAPLTFTKTSSSSTAVDDVDDPGVLLRVRAAATRSSPRDRQRSRLRTHRRERGRGTYQRDSSWWAHADGERHAGILEPHARRTGPRAREPGPPTRDALGSTWTALARWQQRRGRDRFITGHLGVACAQPASSTQTITTTVPVSSGEGTAVVANATGTQPESAWST